ncbi:MAG: CoA pyrophosphatase [Gemmatimonadetes bacterium]|nr:CoA pyrophosphatase [Gemmatimonadota bacterium]
MTGKRAIHGNPDRGYLTSIAEIRRRLAGYRPHLASGDRARAAVAMVLRQREEAVHLLFIERSQREDDPWSGHVAFPGGRVEPGDVNSRTAAERETREELGLDLGKAEYLGRLDDVTGATLPILVSGFVYKVETRDRLHPNHEVKAAFWVQLNVLADPGRHRERSFRIDDAERRFSTIDLPGSRQRVLWGISYRLVSQLLALPSHPFRSSRPTPVAGCAKPGAEG